VSGFGHFGIQLLKTTMGAQTTVVAGLAALALASFNPQSGLQQREKTVDQDLFVFRSLDPGNEIGRLSILRSGTFDYMSLPVGSCWLMRSFKGTWRIHSDTLELHPQSAGNEVARVVEYKFKLWHLELLPDSVDGAHAFLIKTLQCESNCKFLPHSLLFGQSAKFQAPIGK